MQTIQCSFRNWRAQARVEEVDNGKLMAIIAVTDQDDEANQSRHTVVFEHTAGSDTLEETRALVQQLLEARYGA